MHDTESFRSIWHQVEDETGGKWYDEVSTVDLTGWWILEEKFAWMAPGREGLNSLMTRLF